jgi:hypothetical protein
MMILPTKPGGIMEIAVYLTPRELKLVTDALICKASCAVYNSPVQKELVALRNELLKKAGA